MVKFVIANETKAKCHILGSFLPHFVTWRGGRSENPTDEIIITLADACRQNALAVPADHNFGFIVHMDVHENEFEALHSLVRHILYCTNNTDAEGELFKRYDKFTEKERNSMWDDVQALLAAVPTMYENYEYPQREVIFKF